MKFEAKDGEATIWIYDAIGEMFGPDAVTAKGVRDRLHALRGIDRLTIRINSPGGLVDDAVAIHTLLSEYKADKSVKVDGIAASAASVIAMVGGKISVAPGGMMMIHNPWSIAVGDGAALRKAAEVADKYRDNLAAIYGRRTGKSAEEITAAMDAESWYTADEAVAFNLADEAGSDGAVAAYVDDGLFPYKHTPAALKEASPNRHSKVSVHAYRVALARARQMVA
jgi:ATP-dependent Clp protease protease subunit